MMIFFPLKRKTFARGNNFQTKNQLLYFLNKKYENMKSTFSNKNNNISDILLIIGMHTVFVCPNVMLKFHKNISNSFGDIEQKNYKKCI